MYTCASVESGITQIWYTLGNLHYSKFVLYYTGYGDTAQSHLSRRVNLVLLASTFHVFKPVSKEKQVENKPFFCNAWNLLWMSASGLLQTKLLSANHVIILFTWFLDHCNILFGILLNAFDYPTPCSCVCWCSHLCWVNFIWPDTFVFSMCVFDIVFVLVTAANVV